MLVVVGSMVPAVYGQASLTVKASPALRSAWTVKQHVQNLRQFDMHLKPAMPHSGRSQPGLLQLAFHHMI